MWHMTAERVCVGPHQVRNLPVRVVAMLLHLNRQIRCLAKCANPSCSHPFRYLHEGKLYRMELVRDDGGSAPENDVASGGQQTGSCHPDAGKGKASVSSRGKKRASMNSKKLIKSYETQCAQRFRSQFGSRVILKLHETNDGPIAVDIPRASESFGEKSACVHQGRELQSPKSRLLWLERSK